MVLIHLNLRCENKIGALWDKETIEDNHRMSPGQSISYYDTKHHSHINLEKQLFILQSCCQEVIYVFNKY
jgi:endo-1,4-beta-mannosidase